MLASRVLHGLSKFTPTEGEPDQHSPLPWTVDVETGTVLDANGLAVVIDRFNFEPDLEFIARAGNAHYVMLDALKWIRNRVGHLPLCPALGTLGPDACTCGLKANVLDAIAKAEGR